MAQRQAFLSTFSYSPLSITTPLLHIHFRLNTSAIRRTSGRTQGTFTLTYGLWQIKKKQLAFRRAELVLRFYRINLKR